MADFEPLPPREEGDVILMDSVKNAPYALFDWYVDPYEGPNYGRRASFFYNEFSRALPHYLILPPPASALGEDGWAEADGPTLDPTAAPPVGRGVDFLGLRPERAKMLVKVPREVDGLW